MVVSGLGSVLTDTTATIFLVPSVEVLATHHKVQSLYDLYHTITVLGATGYIINESDDYPNVPLIPYEFSCYGRVNTLWSCSRSIISCSNGLYRYSGVSCQGMIVIWCSFNSYCQISVYMEM